MFVLFCFAFCSFCFVLLFSFYYILSCIVYYPLSGYFGGCVWNENEMSSSPWLSSSSFLSPKASTRCGCWNVRSLGNPSKQNSRLRAVLRTMSERAIDVLALSEVRWPGSGVLQVGQQTILFSGVKDGQPLPRSKGVAVALSKPARAAWQEAQEEFHPISERIMRIRLKTGHCNVSIIAVYAPTNLDDQVEEAEKFYLELQKTVSDVPHRDFTLLLGDFNARVGNDSSSWKGVIGAFGPKEKNRNGDRLLDFCALNHLVVTNTLFKHRECHQHTWFHPAEKNATGHILDYALVNRRFRSSVLDTRVFRQTYLQSDHRLVVTTVRFKILARRTGRGQRPTPIPHPKLLTAEQRERFRRVIEDAVPSPGERQLDNVEGLWTGLKDAVDTARQTLPEPNRKPEKDWMTDEVRQLSAKKQQAWLRWTKSGRTNTEAHETFKALRRATRQAVDLARNEWWEVQIGRIEEDYERALKSGRGGSLLKPLKALQRRQRPNLTSSLKSEDGRDTIIQTDLKLERWKEHFEKVTNVVVSVTTDALQDIPSLPPESLRNCGLGSNLSVQESQSSSVFYTDEPDIEEVKDAIALLKNKKAPGVDGMNAECLRLGGEPMAEWLTQVIQAVWRSGEVPEDWRTQITIPLHKKGAYNSCDNFRGIALLSVPGKVLSRIILKRLGGAVDSMVRENQCGFRRGRGCADHLFSLRTIMEKAREFRRPLHLCFVDLSKAYDSVNREALWQVLERRYHIPQAILRLLKALHRGNHGVVRAYGQLSSDFAINNGVRQGDVLAPTLFNLFLDAVLSKTFSMVPDQGVQLVYHPEAKLIGDRRKPTHSLSLSDLEYADDICLASESRSSLEQMLLALDKNCAEMGLSINARKTKIMSVDPSRSTGPDQVLAEGVKLISEDVVENAEEYEYLGSLLTRDCTLDREISRRIGKAAASFRALSRILWYQPRIKKHHKLRMFKAAVLPVLLYGSESWTPLAPHLCRLQGFVMRCLRVILGISRRENLRDTEVRRRAGLPTVDTLIRQRRLRWLGHIMRMEPERLPRQLLACRPAGGSRRAGGQKLRWAEIVARDLKECGAGSDWRGRVSDRREWRALVQDWSATVNAVREAAEKAKKDERKERREKKDQNAVANLSCPDCSFAAQTPAGLTNHRRQKHAMPSQASLKCQFCGCCFKQQGLHSHQLYCARKRRP